MAISTQLNRELHRIFSCRTLITFPEHIKHDLSYENNNVFNLFLRVDISTPEIDVPIMCRSAVEDGIISNYNSANSIKEVSVALFDNSYPQVKRTANSIFKAFQTNNVRDRLVKITTNAGEVYYGGNGYILDKDYNILILYTLHGVIDEIRILHYKTGRIYVNPKCFVSNGLIEKGILKTVIPAFVQEGIKIDNYSSVTTRDCARDGSFPEIIITDVTNRFIVKPKKPIPSTFNCENMNDYLLEHIEEIVTMTHIV